MGQPAIDIERLTVDERLELIDRLWESVSDSVPSLTPEQRIELDRRLDELERAGPQGLSLAEMWARIDKHASRSWRSSSPQRPTWSARTCGTGDGPPRLRRGFVRR